ncbi:MAG: anti-sigma factor [Acidobacteriia bacterium]|nr:anti-sigma factor [Terriglobia bacterium]
MTSRKDNLNEHTRFLELAAIATCDALTSGEMADLEDHLQVCEECRELHRQYQILANEGIPRLAGSYEHRESTGSWDDTSTRWKLFARMEGGEERDAIATAAPAIPHTETNPLHRNTLRTIQGAALAACLVIGVAIGAYRLGGWREAHAKPDEASAKAHSEAMLSAKRSVDALLTEQTERIARLEAESTEKRQDVEKLQRQLQVLQDRLREERASANAGFNGLVAAKANSVEQLSNLAQERDRLSVQLREVSHAYQSVQTELSSMRTERDRSMLRMAALEMRADELAAIIADQDRQLKNSEQYLSSDRDIRELLGARNLYIADIFDVGGSNRTRKPFGRVFYTRGKSLILYAFDLDHQPKVTKASTFQVWGEKETVHEEQAKPRNLGLLYLDSEANRRWILQFDDPRTLAEIDAVFITVEPNGGSPKPTGKPFLFALLRREPNHP